MITQNSKVGSQESGFRNRELGIRSQGDLGVESCNSNRARLCLVRFMVRLPASIIWIYGFDLLSGPTIGYIFQNHFQIYEVSRMLAKCQKMIRTRQRASPDGERQWPWYYYKKD